MDHKNLIAAYEVANENSREVLRKLYPEVDFDGGLKAGQKDNRPVTERIKTFEDALKELGDDHPFVVQYDEILANHFYNANPHDCADIIAYLKLRIICAALNEDMESEFTEDEVRWYPWHLLWTSDELANKSEEWKRDRHLISTGNYQTEYAGFACAGSNNAPSSSAASIGSRLCLNSEALADYCGRQFIDLWADFKLIRRQ